MGYKLNTQVHQRGAPFERIARRFFVVIGSFGEVFNGKNVLRYYKT